jgi:hypothetical protein
VVERNVVTDADYEIRCRCGATVSSTLDVCPDCATVLLGPDVPPQRVPAAVRPAAAESVVASMPARGSFAGDHRWAYGGFWLRLSAWFFDTIVCLAPALAAVRFPLLWLVVLPLVFLYEPVMVATRWQATLGKRVVGLTVMRSNGGRVSFLRSLARHFAKFLSGALFGVGFLMIAFTERKRGLHDLIAGTVVQWG